MACSSDGKHEEEDAKIPLKDRMDLAMKHETKMTNRQWACFSGR